MKVVVRHRNERVVATLYLRIQWRPAAPPELRSVDSRLARFDGRLADVRPTLPLELRRKS